MLQISTAYRLQRRLARQRTAYFRTLKILIGVSAAGWGLAVYITELASSAIGIDLPYALRDTDLFVALIFHVLPAALNASAAIFYFYVAGASADAAGNVFLRRTGIPAQLLSVTPYGFRPVVIAGFLAIYRTFLPYFIVIAAANLGVATYNAFGIQRIQYFYRIGTSLDFSIVINPALFIPPISAFAVSALVTIAASAGMLAVISSIAIAAAVLYPNIRAAIGFLWFLLLCLPIGAWIRYPMPANPPVAAVKSGLSVLLDGGRGLATASLVQYAPDVDYSHRLILEAFIFLIFSVLLALSLLFLCVWRLRTARR